jgi:TonB family protein
MRKSVLVLVLLAACGAPAPPPRPVPEMPQIAPPAEEKAIGTVRVSATMLNVRQDASTDAAVVTQARRGDQLTLLAEKDGWSKVKLPTGEIGFVSSQYLSGGKPRKSKPGCPSDSDFAFVKTPLASFSETGPHGLVVVDATVNTSGDVTATKVISNSTGDESAASMAQREIRAAKFTPPYRNCVPRTFIFTYKRSF